MSRPTRPICVQHETEMRCAQNGRLVQFNASFGPYEIWAGDRYECPIGGESVVVGFAQEPVASHFDAKFERYAERAETVVATP